MLQTENSFKEFLVQSFKELEVSLPYDFEVIVNLESLQELFSIRIIDKKCSVRSEVSNLPHLELLATEEFYRQIFSESYDLVQSFLSGEVLAKGDLSLIIHISRAIRKSNKHRQKCREHNNSEDSSPMTAQ